jgi:dTDP-4-amino-4,6-dideoxygalactose transaminase
MPFVDLGAQRRHLGRRLDVAIERVLAHGQFIMGPEVAELEAELARWGGVRAAVSCGSGTEALLMPLMAWGVCAGDAVFVPAFTFPATAEVASLLGATPVFVDVREETFNMDVESLKRALNHAHELGLRPRVVISVDLFGQPADYAAISPVAQEAGLLLLADAAQSFGASYLGRPVGSFGDATATSFFPAKPLGCYGDGGAVLTDDEALADVIRSVRNHGEGIAKYDTVRTGINGRLDTIQAAVLLEKLGIFGEELEARNHVAARYSETLRDRAVTPTLLSGATSSWAQYTLQVPDRDRLVSDLKRSSIPTAVHYPRPLHHQPAYADGLIPPGGLRVAESLSRRVVSLPMHPYLEAPVQAQVIDAVLASLNDMARVEPPVPPHSAEHA